MTFSLGDRKCLASDKSVHVINNSLPQFVSEDDDLFETLNDSLNRDGLGQTSLDDQFEFGIGRLGDDGLPQAEEYDFGKSQKIKALC